MSWFNTVMNAASLGVGIANANRLEQMRAQGAAASLIEAFVGELRNQVFHYKETAENILAREGEVGHKITAGAMRLIDFQLTESGISPEFFPELSDKEYVANAKRMIGQNSARLYGKLSPAEQQEVDRMVAAADELPDLAYYLEHFENGRELKAATELHKQLAPFNTTLVRTLAFVGVFALPLLAMRPFQGSALVSNIVGLGVFIACAVFVGRWVRAKDFNKAKKTVGKLKDSLDLEYFTDLDHKYKGNRGEALARRDQAQQTVQAFFGDTPLLSDDR